MLWFILPAKCPRIRLSDFDHRPFTGRVLRYESYLLRTKTRRIVEKTDRESTQPYQNLSRYLVGSISSCATLLPSLVYSVIGYTLNDWSVGYPSDQHFPHTGVLRSLLGLLIGSWGPCTD